MAEVGNFLPDLTQLFNDALVTSTTPERNPGDNLVHSTTTTLQTSNGNVPVRISWRNLNITGDKFNNKLRIEPASAANPDAFRIIPVGGTKINGQFDSVQVHGIKGDVYARLNAGNDTLFFDGPMTFKKGLFVYLGAGADQVSLADVTVLGKGFFSADQDADVILIVDSIFGNYLDIRTGTGGDQVTIEGTTVAKDIAIRNDGQNDTVSMLDSVFNGNASLDGGSGLFDTLTDQNNVFSKKRTVKGFELILP